MGFSFAILWQHSIFGYLLPSIKQRVCQIKALNNEITQVIVIFIIIFTIQVSLSDSEILQKY